jgi:hypothetical protein
LLSCRAALSVVLGVVLTACSGSQYVFDQAEETLRPETIHLASATPQTTEGLAVMLEAWPVPRATTRARILTDGVTDGLAFEPAPSVNGPLNFVFSLPDAPQFLGAVVVWKTVAPLRVEIASFLGATPLVPTNFDSYRNSSIVHGAVELPAGEGPFVLQLSSPTYAHAFWVTVTGAEPVHGLREVSALTAAGLEAITGGPLELLVLESTPEAP